MSSWPSPFSANSNNKAKPAHLVDRDGGKPPARAPKPPSISIYSPPPVHLPPYSTPCPAAAAHLTSPHHPSEPSLTGSRAPTPMAATGQLRRRTRARTPPRADDGDDDVSCEACGSGHAAAELMLCDGCDRGFHIFCLRPILPRVPAGDWFCPSCRSPAAKSTPAVANKPKREYSHLCAVKFPFLLIYSTFPLVQTKIVDFFKIQRNPLNAAAAAETKKRKRKPAGALVVSKKKRKLLPFNPSEDPAQRLRQMASLATALTATGAVFSNHLTYLPGMAPRSANRAALESGGMQVLPSLPPLSDLRDQITIVLPKEDVEALSQCQRMMERGECPPLLVVYDPVEGFTVEADRFIKDLTIITEYVGDVDYLRNRENDDGDSMMTLLSLVICPDRRSNIARFINGINNHTPEGRKKQNLKCVRFDVAGECRVLLVANRDISKGERLYYDYNGSEHEYPTHHFV
ncbi:hypothetical protein HU200_046681 [Digitaria exilis]|uniref:Histone-lysine N-methyltransferase ATXR6 n=1 Tax=Digitaria exilis TaxID=1010633 RepID=A0A835AY43_9POAL|nr:hypothetical protein HU200_046681 [Digitaria exilis]